MIADVDIRKTRPVYRYPDPDNSQIIQCLYIKQDQVSTFTIEEGLSIEENNFNGLFKYEAKELGSYIW